ncbi:hypothetical protein [Nocardioides sp.]|uniref:hypothetical protein n=1 Tax=Nocardioides sp. TaxID=35761 RepID=UPI00262FD9B1|nr:hypothetical protein [Nocardioides sp.]MCW2739416.1 hypothetical protein [Nocardioides sp.]
MSLRPAARLLAALVPAVLLLPAAAHAEKVVTEDAVGDSLQYTVEPDSGNDVFVPAPEDTSADVMRTVVAHGDRRLAITVHVADLRRTDYFSAFARVATPLGSYGVDVSRERGSRTHAVLGRGPSRDVECRGLRARIDEAADTVTMTLPTSCIGAPRWVQVGVGVVTFEMPTDPDQAEIVLMADDGHRDGVIRENSIGKGSKVRRG